MKVWHDDIRRPPDDSWTWARTNEEAKLLILNNNVKEISLDHDMGLEAYDPDEQDADLRIGSSEQDGYELVKWMCEWNRIPAIVSVHSWNPIGAKRMALLFQDYGVKATVKPWARD